MTHRRIDRWAGGAVAAAALVAGTMVPGPASAAAPPGWRQVYSAHYGPADDYSGFTSVVATSKDSAWALGGSDDGGGGARDYPVVSRWNGHAWRDYPLPVGSTRGAGFPDDINAVSAPAANDIWAVTWNGGWVLHWNGSKWLVARHFTTGGEITGVTALSPTDVWVFGGNGQSGGLGTWHYNGKSWIQWHGDATDLQSGSALGATDIWAIGGTKTPSSSIVHYNGTWRLVSASALAGLSFMSLQAFSNTNIWVTAAAADGVVLLHNNGKWGRVKLPWGLSPDPNSPQGPFSDGRGGIWLIAKSGSGQLFLVHRTATGAWNRVAIGTAHVVRMAQIPGTSSLWAVGWNSIVGKPGGKAVVWADGAV